MNNDKRIIARVARMAKTMFLALVVAMTCSCEDFLTILPTDKIVLEDFWKSKGDVDNVVAESYRLMSQWNFMSRLVVWGELRGDNVIEGNYNGNNEIKNIMEANLLPSNGYASWSEFYRIINNCNIVLKYAPGVLEEDPDFTQGDLDVVRGEMLAIRALCHFYLVRTFRDVPLLTEAMVDDSQYLYQAQVKPIEALDCCLQDLFEAENLVLTSGNYPDEDRNKGRMTKDAVRSMIADVYLWKAAFLACQANGDANVAEARECYDMCVEYCDRVLDTRMAYMEKYQKDHSSNNSLRFVELNDSFPIMYPSESYDGYELTGRFPNYPYSLQFANGGNCICESIFEIQHGTVSSTGNNEVPYFFGYSTDEKSFTVGMLSASRYLAVLKGGLYKRTDFRRVNYINSESGEDVDKFGIVKYGYSSANEDRSKLSGDNAPYNFGKVSYQFLQNNTGGGMRFFDKNRVNWIVYRVSDVMLMKAEALALRGSEQDLADAYRLVEAVYNRSQTGYKKADGTPVGRAQDADYLKQKDYVGQASILRLVLDERQREFAFEGKRWFDLVRWALREGKTNSMLDIMISNKYESNHDQYKTKMATINSLFFPIAEREINTNDLLHQNEAYKTEDKYEKN